MTSVLEPKEAGRAPGSLFAIFVFLAITFAATYAVEVAWLARGVRFDEADAKVNFGLFAIMWIPAVAAQLTKRLVSKSAFVRPQLPRPSFILSSIFLPPLVFGIIYGLSAALGWATFDPDLQQMTKTLSAETAVALPPKFVILLGTLFASMTFGLFFTCLGTAGEELGWTGFLLPRLLARLSPLPSAVLYGTIWGLWHAPLIYGGFNYPGEPLAGIALMCLFCIALAMVQTAVWLRTRTVLATTLVHASVNAQARGLWALLFPQATVSVLLGGAAGLVGVVIIAVIGFLWLRFEQRNAVA